MKLNRACYSKPLPSVPDRTLPALPAHLSNPCLNIPCRDYPCLPCFSKPCTPVLASTFQNHRILNAPCLRCFSFPNLSMPTSPSQNAPGLRSLARPCQSPPSASFHACGSLPYSPDHPASLHTSSVHAPPAVPALSLMEMTVVLSVLQH